MGTSVSIFDSLEIVNDSGVYKHCTVSFLLEVTLSAEVLRIGIKMGFFVTEFTPLVNVQIL